MFDPKTFVFLVFCVCTTHVIVPQNVLASNKSPSSASAEWRAADWKKKCDQLQKEITDSSYYYHETDRQIFGAQDKSDKSLARWQTSSDWMLLGSMISELGTKQGYEKEAVKHNIKIIIKKLEKAQNDTEKMIKWVVECIDGEEAKTESRITSKHMLFLDYVTKSNLREKMQWTVVAPAKTSGRQKGKYTFFNDWIVLYYALDIGPVAKEWNTSMTLSEDQDKSDKEMESDHGYVQLWYPTIKEGSNHVAPRISPPLYNIIQNNAKIRTVWQQNAMKLWSRTLDYMGIEEELDTAGNSRYVFKKDGDAEIKNIINNDHNGMRMTRYIQFWNTIDPNSLIDEKFQTFITDGYKANERWAQKWGNAYASNPDTLRNWKAAIYENEGLKKQCSDSVQKMNTKMNVVSPVSTNRPVQKMNVASPVSTNRQFSDSSREVSGGDRVTGAGTQASQSKRSRSGSKSRKSRKSLSKSRRKSSSLAKRRGKNKRKNRSRKV